MGYLIEREPHIAALFFYTYERCGGGGLQYCRRKVSGYINTGPRVSGLGSSSLAISRSLSLYSLAFTLSPRALLRFLVIGYTVMTGHGCFNWAQVSWVAAEG